jgi:phosphoglycerate kinase
MGRPNGQKSAKLSLKPVADYLSSAINRKVTFLDDCVGENVINSVNKANGEIFLCENVRFHE